MKKQKFNGREAEECRAVDWSAVSVDIEKKGKSRKKDEYKWDIDDVEESWSIDFDDEGRRIEPSTSKKPKKPVDKDDLGSNIVTETLNQIAREGILRADGEFVTGEIDAEAIRKSVDDKIIIKAEELKEKKRPKKSNKAVKTQSNKNIKAQPNNDVKIRIKKDADKYKKLGEVHATSKKKGGPSEFRKGSANWRYDNTPKADTNDADIEETIDNESFADKIRHFSPIQYICVGMAVVILVTGVLTTGVYADYRGQLNRAEAFANLPRFEENMSLAQNEDFSEEEVFMDEAAVEPSSNEGKMLSLILTSVEKDLKIKLVDEEDTLVKGVKWGVSVEDSDGDTSEYEDEDEDGIIHLTDISAGDYTVSVIPSDNLSEYDFPTVGQQVSVKAKVEYKVIANIKDEIKKESEVNAALEDNGNQAADVETGTALVDTVNWVESTEEATGEEEYEEAFVDLSKTEKLVAIGSRIKTAIREFVNKTTGIFNDRYVLASVGGPILRVADNESSDGSANAAPGANPDSVEPSLSAAPAESGDNSSSSSSSTETTDSSSSSSTEATPDSSSSSSSLELPDLSEILRPESNEGATGEVKSVTLDKSSVTLNKDENITLNLSFSPSGSMPENVRWSTLDSSVATVSDGVVTAVSAGTTKIGAVVNSNILVYCEVTVADGEKSDATDGDNSVTLSGPGTVLMGETITIQATVKPESDGIVEWKSDNSDVVSLTADGIKCYVTGEKAGSTVVRAISSSGAEGKITIKVTGSEEYADDAQLYDSNKNKLYVYDNSEYRLAKYIDYKSGKFTKYFRKVADLVYTGWQTIDGITYYFTENHEKVTGEQVIGGVTYHFDSDGALAKGSGTLGIDVSKYQPSINWASVKASGISYVIIRCGYRGASTGSLIQDPYFTSHIKGAKAAGLKVGVYFFSTALNEAEAVEEASMCAALCSGYGINYPVFIDVEPSSRPGYNGLSASQRTANIKAFCQTISSAGYTPGLYANKTWLSSYINTSSLSCKIWLAQYNSQGPTYSGHYDMWQYTSKGKVDGISGNVDMNQSYMGY